MASTQYQLKQKERFEFPHIDMPMKCDHQEIKSLLMQQWKELTEDEIEATEYSKHKLAVLIESHYGIHNRLAENYLNNLERTLPLAS